MRVWIVLALCLLVSPALANTDPCDIDFNLDLCCDEADLEERIRIQEWFIVQYQEDVIRIQQLQAERHAEYDALGCDGFVPPNEPPECTALREQILRGYDALARAYEGIRVHSELRDRLAENLLACQARVIPIQPSF